MTFTRKGRLVRLGITAVMAGGLAAGGTGVALAASHGRTASPVRTASSTSAASAARQNVPANHKCPHMGGS